MPSIISNEIRVGVHERIFGEISREPLEGISPGSREPKIQYCIPLPEKPQSEKDGIFNEK